MIGRLRHSLLCYPRGVVRPGKGRSFPAGTLVSYDPEPELDEISAPAIGDVTIVAVPRFMRGLVDPDTVIPLSPLEQLAWQTKG